MFKKKELFIVLGKTKPHNVAFRKDHTEGGEKCQEKNERLLFFYLDTKNRLF